MEKQAKQKEKAVIYKNITELKPYKKNAKKHPKEQVELYKQWLVENGCDTEEVEEYEYQVSEW